MIKLNLSEKEMRLINNAYFNELDAKMERNDEISRDEYELGVYLHEENQGLHILTNVVRTAILNKVADKFNY